MMILESGIGNYITLNGEKYSYFAGNNYLGLANHPVVKKDVISAIERYGLNFSASRETTGTSDLHLQLENLLSQFKNKQESVVFASGYLGNKILLHALRDQFSAVFTDEFAHPSILDGIPSDISEVYLYSHRDVEHLESLLKKNKKYKPLIITDGIFALTGEIAPIDKIYSLAKKYEANLVVDDAHATGILGENGRGVPEHFQLDNTENVFQTETMSKALGGYGGFISSSKEMIREVRKKSSVYIGTTALPPPVVGAGCAAIHYLQNHPELRSRLLENSREVKNRVNEIGFSTSSDPTPIVPIFFKSLRNAQEFSNFLNEHFIIAPNVKYPVKTDKFIVRITVSTTHTEGQIDQLLQLIKTWRDKHGID